MQCVTRPRITELNPHLLCVLCGGYYIDATAIIECLHSFCKSCIVRYLETHKYCPICDVLVHKTKPLQNIRPDTILQNIVYKLVPNLYEREMLNRRKYYVKVHPSQHPASLEEKGEITESSNFYSSSDTINFSLEYSECLESKNDVLVEPACKRYFRCKTPVTIESLRKLVAAKYGLVRDYEIRFFYNEIQLPEHLTLLDIAYISSWKRRDFIRILYQILEVRKLVVKDETQTPPVVTIPPLIPLSAIPKTDAVSNTSPCRVIAMENNKELESTRQEVPEKASTPISSQSGTVSSVVGTESSEVSVSSNASPSACDSIPSVTVTSIISTAELTVFTASAPITTPVCVTKVNGVSSDTEVPRVVESKMKEEKDKSISCINETSKKGNGLNLATEVAKKTSIKENQQTLPKSSPVPVKRKIDSVNAVEKKIKASSSEIVTDMKESAKSSPTPSKIPKLAVEPVKIVYDEEVKKSLKVANHVPLKPIPNMLKLVTTAPLSSSSPLSITVTSACLSAGGSRNTFKKSTNVPTTMSFDTVQKSAPRPIFTRSELPTITKSKPPIMKTFTRPWSTPNPTSATPVATSPRVEVKDKVKPMKIIEARNTPRFLGNPASGIRPLFQVAPPNKMVKKEDVKKPIKKLSVTKIDPQTLSPIAATSSSCSSTPASSSIISKNAFAYSRPPAELYARSTFTSPSLAALTTSSSLAAKSQSSFLLQNLQYNPMYPMNQLFELYDGALGCMKAMTSNFCHPSLFHPMHANLNALYGPLHKNAKLEKPPHAASLTSKSPPPTVQRIPPSNNNTKLLSLEEHSNDGKNVAASGTAKHKSVPNGQLKNKTKKSPEVSNFSINNLIPLEAVKHEHVSHSCSADGVNQICDQMSPDQKKSDEKDVKEADNKADHTKKD